MRIRHLLVLPLLVASPATATDLASELQAQLVARIEARASVELYARTTALLEDALSRARMEEGRYPIASPSRMRCGTNPSGRLDCVVQPSAGAEASLPADLADSE